VASYSRVNDERKENPNKECVLQEEEEEHLRGRPRTRRRRLRRINRSPMRRM
jgi:hypothetical protein